MTSQRNGTLYIGVSIDLPARVYQHKHDSIPGFTSSYGVHTLVSYEGFDDIRLAIQREKQLKKWNRIWKIRLIESVNPDWRDLADLI